MVRVTKEDIVKISRIANISLADSEVQALMSDVQNVLDYASSLQDIAQRYSSVAPFPKQINVMREDSSVVTDNQALLSLAPVREENFFVVPVIIKQDKA